jgi:hypothetical protein
METKIYFYTVRRIVMKKRIVLGLVAAVFSVALGVVFAVPAADAARAEDAVIGGIATDGIATEDVTDNAACRQWCSRRVCNSKDQCWITYYCCG